MRLRTAIFSVLLLGLVLFFTPVSQAQTRRSVPSPTPLSSLSASVSAQATPSGEVATPSATTVSKIDDKKDKDITETTSGAKNRLVQLVEKTPLGPVSPLNFLQHLIRRGVSQNVPANILVLTLLFPVIASFIAVSRHMLGLEGFGIYTPAVLAVALLSTGIVSGLLLFAIILVVASVGREILKHVRLQYLPRTALLLWSVSLSVFFILLASPYLARIGIDLLTLSIFPILVLILLSENFLEALLAGTQKRALELTAETMLLAVLSALFIRTEMVQEFVLLHPEMTILGVFLIDVAVGKYTGLRISEYFRFKPILDSEE